MYLTHYGRVGDVQRLAELLFEQIDAMVALALTARGATERHVALKSGLTQLCRDQLLRHGVQDVELGIARLALDIELNAQGLGIWLDRAPG